MASLNNSNALNTLAPAQNNLRRRPICAATELIAKSVVNLVDVPGLNDSVRTAREIVGALKPNILQEPARNDLITQNLIDYIDEILLCAQGGGAEVDSEYLEDLQQIHGAVVELKNKPYRTKLASKLSTRYRKGAIRKERGDHKAYSIV
ncbi:hypothetical protein RSOLAG22IIIB_12349 [Rhizoctonia solani]|uniref:Uncharacterized protein n=1 Tax=Rhizoctonia solani TaxID=456999 RepID=A0A0K6GDU2_9AGAM|nr:hypothetical protein RSOLAG22IIIB_12349 [Rhizoctonia solani]